MLLILYVRRGLYPQEVYVCYICKKFSLKLIIITTVLKNSQFASISAQIICVFITHKLYTRLLINIHNSEEHVV
jgi:hypothetical protein